MGKYYLVDELDNDGYCFDSISAVKEDADELGLTLEELTIYDTKMKPLKLCATYLVETEIDNCDLFEGFNIDEIPEEKLQELQELLDAWCKDIDTNTYERSKKLSIEEVRKRQELENEKINL